MEEADVGGLKTLGLQTSSIHFLVHRMDAHL